MTEAMNHDVLEFSDAIAGGTAWSHDVAARASARMQRASKQLHFAVREMPPDSPYKLSFNTALRLMQRVLDGGRLALQGLRSTSIAPPGTLEEALSRFRNEVPPGVLFRIVVTGKSKGLKPEIQEQLYLIVREALVNALRHSKATRIEADIEYLPHRLRLFVCDNGCGMDPQVLRAAAPDGHGGLQEMRERAQRIGAKLQIRSRPGAGTEVEISIPGDIVAYTCA
jgi:signal transduction histidine kinase